MKLAKILVVLLILVAVSVNGLAQGSGKAIDDGAGKYAVELLNFHSANPENMLKKKDFEPFTVSFFGWRALTIARLPFNKFEGSHLNICRLALNIYDNELDTILQTLVNRPTQISGAVEATAAEKDTIQKFVVRKYGDQYLLPGINAVLASDAKTVPKKRDETAAWKYSLGATLGELSGSVTKWFWFPNHPKYDEAISETLRSLDKQLQNAPKDAPTDLLTSLKRLAAFGSKKFFTPQEREQIGLALKQTLMNTLGFAKPMEVIAQTLKKTTPAPTKPVSGTTPADTAKAKEIAEQYRQYGLRLCANRLYDPAIGEFNRAAELDPNNQYIYSNRGQAYLEKGEADKAIADFTKAITINGITVDDHYYFNDRARAYLKKGNLELALADVNQAIALYANNAYGYYLRGFIYKSRGNTAQARADFQAALKVNPNYQPAKDELVKLGQ
jgi:tetratricopeptide (TPR) repeat protein